MYAYLLGPVDQLEDHSLGVREASGSNPDRSMPHMPEHPTLHIRGTKSQSLQGKKIVLGVTGSIAAVRTVELARELIRHGADVYGVMSNAAMEIIHPYTLHYATGHEVITKLMGKIEHVEFLGMQGYADLYLIAPCTANTLNKIATGVSDTTVTAFATTAFGSGIPIIVVPAMHETIYRSPVLIENIKKLKQLGVTVIEPKLEEGLAKIATSEEIILEVERKLSEGTLAGKRVLITGGPTIEPIDFIRVLTNRSSGLTGVELAKAAYRQGAEVTLVHSMDGLSLRAIKMVKIETAREMVEACMNELRNARAQGKAYDVLISSAAIADFTLPELHDGKIPSGGKVSLMLVPTPKLIAEVSREFPDLAIVGFKAEVNVTESELIERARQKLEKYKLVMVVANDLAKGGMGTEENEVFIIRRDNDYVKHIKGKKSMIAAEIINELAELVV